MVLNMASGGAAVSVMAREAGMEYAVVDVGVKTELPHTDGILSRNVCRGTADSVSGPAMTVAQCESAMRVGYELAAATTADVLGTGDMGIGNTAASSALYALLLGIAAEDTVGVGTGSAGETLQRKRAAVSKAVARHRAEWDGSPFDALCRVGGLEIAAMCGFMLGASVRGIPVAVDGFISSAAALAATRINPALRGYLLYSHCSAEKFHREYLDRERIRPLLDLDMRLGEGTGAVLAIQVLMQAMSCYHHMASFSSAGVANKSE
jgi:nicotinate-nucleotide--dimethylbenzimidazole phosphoribosyltransferase